MALKREDLKVGGKFINSGGAPVVITAIGKTKVLAKTTDEYEDEFGQYIEFVLSNWSLPEKPKKKITFYRYTYILKDTSTIEQSNWTNDKYPVFDNIVKTETKEIEVDYEID